MGLGCSINPFIDSLAWQLKSLQKFHMLDYSPDQDAQVSAFFSSFPSRCLSLGIPSLPLLLAAYIPINIIIPKLFYAWKGGDVEC